MNFLLSLLKQYSIFGATLVCVQLLITFIVLILLIVDLADTAKNDNDYVEEFACLMFFNIIVICITCIIINFLKNRIFCIAYTYFISNVILFILITKYCSNEKPLNKNQKEILNFICELSRKDKKDMIKYMEPTPYIYYYNDINNYQDLLIKILNDKFYKKFLDGEQILLLANTLKQQNDKNTKSILKLLGWRLSKNGLAVHFDNSFIKNHF